MSGVPIGSVASSRLAFWVPLTVLLRATSAIAVLRAALFFVAAASGMLNLATVLVPMILFSVGVGACGPVAITSAISTDPQMIGAASGLYGFMQMANGALCTLAVGFSPANPPYPPPVFSRPSFCSASTFSSSPPEGGPPAPVSDPALSCAGKMRSRRPS